MILKQTKDIKTLNNYISETLSYNKCVNEWQLTDGLDIRIDNGNCILNESNNIDYMIIEPGGTIYAFSEFGVKKLIKEIQENDGDEIWLGTLYELLDIDKYNEFVILSGYLSKDYNKDIFNTDMMLGIKFNSNKKSK